MTADTFSNTLGFLVMGTGNDNNTWGSNANSSVFQIFEDAIANALTNSVTGGTLDLSGTPPPAAASQVRYAALIFNGTLGSNQIIQVPNLTKFWWVQNATAGAFTLVLKTPAGVASTAIPQNSGWQLVQCDGANGITVSPFNSKQIQLPDGSQAAPAYSNVNETGSGWRRAGTQDWRFVINGVDVLQLTGTGAGTPSILNVLSPNALEVNGVPIQQNWVVAGGTADAITATYVPAIAALTDGLLCFFRAAAANATTTPTFAPNGLTAHTITKKGGVALAANDIPGNLAEIILRYNLANTRWEILNPTFNPSPSLVPTAQCQLTKSGSSLLLSPYAGNVICINSALQTIPDAGVSLTTSGLAASTLYYIYAFMNSGTMTLEPSATAYAVQAGTGVTIKSGDATRTLVGMARTSGAIAWTDSITQRFVRSYYNDPGIALLNSFSANRTTTSTSYAELNSEIRIEFVAWTGETVQMEANGTTLASTANNTVFTSIGIDGTTAEDTYANSQAYTGASDAPFAVALYKAGLTEGYHYATLLGKSPSGGTQTWYGSGTAGTRSTLRGYAKFT